MNDLDLRPTSVPPVESTTVYKSNPKVNKEPTTNSAYARKQAWNDVDNTKVKQNADADRMKESVRSTLAMYSDPESTTMRVECQED